MHPKLKKMDHLKSKDCGSTIYREKKGWLSNCKIY